MASWNQRKTGCPPLGPCASAWAPPELVPVVSPKPPKTVPSALNQPRLRGEQRKSKFLSRGPESGGGRAAECPWPSQWGQLGRGDRGKRVPWRMGQWRDRAEQTQERKAQRPGWDSWTPILPGTALPPDPGAPPSVSQPYPDEAPTASRSWGSTGLDFKLSSSTSLASCYLLPLGIPACRSPHGPLAILIRAGSSAIGPRTGHAACRPSAAPQAPGLPVPSPAGSAQGQAIQHFGHWFKQLPARRAGPQPGQVLREAS